MGGIPPPSALWAVCITPRLMELWATLFAGCGKAAFAFPYAVNFRAALRRDKVSSPSMLINSNPASIKVLRRFP